MDLKELLSSWTGITKINEDTTILEYFEDIHPERCYFIDRFPKVVEDNSKYSQLEVFYGALQDGDISSDLYKSEEEKLINIIKKLWAFSLVKCEMELSSFRSDTLTTLIGNEQVKLFDELRSRRGLFEVDKVNELELLLKLGIMEKVISCLVFIDLKIVIWTNGFVMPLFINDLRTKELIEKITLTEGLYLRPLK